MTALRSLALSLALVLTPLSLSAQTQPIDPVEEHLRLGVELRRSGHNDEALVEFEAAYGLRREPRTAAQLGLASQAVGRWLRADALLREGLAAPDDPWITRNRAALDGALSVVGRHLATVELLGDVAGARVRVNGEDAGTLPLAAPVRVVAGTVAVDVTAEGYEALSLRFVASAGEILRERITLVAARPAQPPAQPPVSPPPVIAPPVIAPPVTVTAPAPRPPWGPLAIASFASAAVLVAGGVTALVLQESATSDYNAQCDAGDARGACGTLRDRAVAAGAVGWTTIPLGALVAAAGTYFLVRDRAPTARTTARSACGAGLLSVHCGFVF
ncbi:MAG: hypothetical protein U0326_28375 [Polyangiales bacterium]